MISRKLVISESVVLSPECHLLIDIATVNKTFAAAAAAPSE